MDAPETSYARSGGAQIAFQVLGSGPPDIVMVAPFLSNIELAWDLPGGYGHMLERIASFSRLILIDRRGNGMSGGVAGGTQLEDQVDDVRAVIAAAGSEHPVLLSALEGCALSALLAASSPELVRALVLMNPVPRLTRAPDYPWAHSAEERAALVATWVEHWGSSSPDNPMLRFAAGPATSGRAFARFQRLAMSPDEAAASLAVATAVDVRHVLPSIQCPTLVLRRAGDTTIDPGHSRFVVDQIPNARLVELPGEGQVWLGEDQLGVDEIQQFVTGARQSTPTDRVLATVLFTDIVGSTERAAELGDSAWRELLGRHDLVVRQEVEHHRGRVVKSLGDGGLALFDGPSRAISGALAIREGLRVLGLEIRAGLHTGECELIGDDVGGLAVHIGARISGLAAPGEVLASSTVRDLSVGSEHSMTDRGEHELKGVPGPWRIFSVDA